MSPSRTRRPRRGSTPAGSESALAVAVALVMPAAAVGCGSTSSDTPASGATPTSIQVMATATRGDLTQSAMGRAELRKRRRKPVARGDHRRAERRVGRRRPVRHRVLLRGGGFPQSGQSGVPAPQGSGMPQLRPAHAPGGPAARPSRRAARVACGGLRSWRRARRYGRNRDGRPDERRRDRHGDHLRRELPSGATDSTGFARHRGQGPRQQRHPGPHRRHEGQRRHGDRRRWSQEARRRPARSPVGQRSGGMSEVVSGLDEGEDVVYTQAFRGSPGRRPERRALPAGRPERQLRSRSRAGSP